MTGADHPGPQSGAGLGETLFDPEPRQESARSRPNIHPELHRRRRVLITGGARGLGRACALDLASSGWDVAVIDRDLEAYREFPEEAAADPVLTALSVFGGQPLAYTADVTDPRQLGKVAVDIAARWGCLDGLVCNAGGGSGGLLDNRAATVGIGDLRSALERNLFGTVHTVQAMLELLRAGEEAAIVTMSSLNGLTPTDTGGYAHYGVAKAAVAHYSRYLAKDLGEAAIRVNCLAPGPIATGRLLHRMAESPAANRGIQNALGRTGTAADVVPVVSFLLGPGSRYLTGQVFRVDGGL